MLVAVIAFIIGFVTGYVLRCYTEPTDSEPTDDRKRSHHKTKEDGGVG